MDGTLFQFTLTPKACPPCAREIREHNCVVGFETVRNVCLGNSRCKKPTIRKRLKRQKKKGGKLSVDLVKLAKIAISPILGKGLAEFEVAFTNP
jgi:hypothetical protein